MFTLLATPLTILLTLAGVASTASAAVALHPSGNDNFCLDVGGGIMAHGTRVQIYECNGTPAQKWEFVTGQVNLLKVAGTNLCLHQQQYPGREMEIWTCPNTGWPYDMWYHSTPEGGCPIQSVGAKCPDVDADRVVVIYPSSFGGHRCLDLKDGVMASGASLQLWECFHGNTNQRWTKTSV